MRAGGRGPLAEVPARHRGALHSQRCEQALLCEVGGPDKSSSQQASKAATEPQAAEKPPGGPGGVVKKAKDTVLFSCERFNANNMVLLGLGVFYYLFT